jgi:hypothetical protein
VQGEGTGLCGAAETNYNHTQDNRGLDHVLLGRQEHQLRWQFRSPRAAAPALSADQAWAKFASGAGLGTAITSDTTVQLGSLTEEVGPYCGTECDMWTT